MQEQLRQNQATQNETAPNQTMPNNAMQEKIAQQEQRITELETTVAFLDDTLEQLNTIISKQDMELVEQKRLLAMLVEKFVKNNNESIIEKFNASEEVPPHY